MSDPFRIFFARNLECQCFSGTPKLTSAIFGGIFVEDFYNFDSKWSLWQNHRKKIDHYHFIYYFLFFFYRFFLSGFIFRAALYRNPWFSEIKMYCIVLVRKKNNFLEGHLLELRAHLMKHSKEHFKWKSLRKISAWFSWKACGMFSYRIIEGVNAEIHSDKTLLNIPSKVVILIVFTEALEKLWATLEEKASCTF